MHLITSFYNANIQMIFDKDHNGILYICAGQKPKHNNVQVAQPNYNTQLIIIQQTKVHNIQSSRPSHGTKLKLVPKHTQAATLTTSTGRA